MRPPSYLAWAGLILALVASELPGSVAGAAPAAAPGRLLVGFRPGVLPERVQALLKTVRGRSTGQIPQIGVHIVQLPPKANATAAAQVLRRKGEVGFAELDYHLPPDLTPNDPAYSSQWHLPRIAAPTAWNSTVGSSSVVIAILDTGVDGTHPDLASKLVPGWNFYNNNADTADVHGHGTAVAGTAAAAGSNGIGVASVAWGCRLMPLRVSDLNGYAYTSTLANALTWAADHGARVANMSYGVSQSSTVASAASYFQSRGGVVAVSAGNEATFSSAADSPYLLTVSATHSGDGLTSWSNTGNNVDLAAPGQDILTTSRGGGYSWAAGTSFSAPIVAGVGALVLSANPALSGAQVQEILKQSADDLGSTGWDPSYGWGRVNAARAVSLALGTGGSVDTTPPTVSFSVPSAGATVSGTITVQVNAADNVGVTSVALSVDGTSLGTKTSAPYSFSWNTTSLANGTHTLTATAVDGAGNSASAQSTVTVSNTSDTTAPTIAITAPANGASVSGMVSVTVNAADNVQVTRVELYVDGKRVATSTTAPFTTKWNARKAASGAHTCQCKAYDAAGNVGGSAGITVYK